MSPEPAEAEPTARERAERAERAERRRRLAEVFGDVLPEQTRDDSDDSADPQVRDDGAEDWLRRQVPPHHGQ